MPMKRRIVKNNANTKSTNSTSTSEKWSGGSYLVIVVVLIIVGTSYIWYGDNGSPVNQGFSFIIPIRDEDLYIARTINYFAKDTYPGHIHEIVLFDDASVIPVESWIYEAITPDMVPKVKVIRSDEPVGLIKARVIAARTATSQYIFFVDGHCRPQDKKWSAPLLESIIQHPKRMVVPTIFALEVGSWRNIGHGNNGAKMMFDWTFEFYWVADNSPEVPIMPGGVFAVDRDYYTEIGEFDEGMQEWGGENIELSIRVWTCGGEIHNMPSSLIGHLFDRPPKDNTDNKLVERIQLNHLRVARVWLDNYSTLFYKHHHSCRHFLLDLESQPDHVENNLESRIQLRKDLKCKPFQSFVDRFRFSFDHLGLIEKDYHLIKDETGMCLTADRVTNTVFRDVCQPLSDTNLEQQWINYYGKRILKIRNKIAHQALFDINSDAIRGVEARINEPVTLVLAKSLEPQFTDRITNFPVTLDLTRIDSNPGDLQYPVILPTGEETGKIVTFANKGLVHGEDYQVLDQHLNRPFSRSELCIGFDGNMAIWVDCGLGASFRMSN